MLYKIPAMGQGIQSFFKDLHHALTTQVTRMIEERLEEDVNSWSIAVITTVANTSIVVVKQPVRSVAVCKRAISCEMVIGNAK